MALLDGIQKGTYSTGTVVYMSVGCRGSLDERGNCYACAIFGAPAECGRALVDERASITSTIIDGSWTPWTPISSRCCCGTESIRSAAAPGSVLWPCVRRSWKN